MLDYSIDHLHCFTGSKTSRFPGGAAEGPRRWKSAGFHSFCLIHFCPRKCECCQKVSKTSAMLPNVLKDLVVLFVAMCNVGTKPRVSAAVSCKIHRFFWVFEHPGRSETLNWRPLLAFRWATWSAASVQASRQIYKNLGIRPLAATVDRDSTLW